MTAATRMLRITVFFFFFLNITVNNIGPSHAANSISQFKPLKHPDTLVSEGGLFEMGFFGPQTASKNRYYLGIWFKNTFYTKAMWIANRDNPIADSYGVLSIDVNGVLKIEHSGGRPIELYSNTESAGIHDQHGSRNVTATLLDSGNFELIETNYINGTRRLLWQSFDHPTDTLLPGMKLSIDTKETSKNLSLTSWLTNELPASGAFTLIMNVDCSQLMIQRRGETYWRSGIWTTTNPKLELMPKFTPDRDEYKFSYVWNGEDHQRKFNISLNNDSINKEGLAKLSLIWVMKPEGELMQYEIHGRNFLPTVSIKCNTGSLVKGCEGQELPECRRLELPSSPSSSSGEYLQKYNFQKKKGRMESDPFWMLSDHNLSLSDCEAKCLSNCSCIAYASHNEDETGCNFWVKGSKFIAEDGAKALNIYILPSQHHAMWWLWCVSILLVVLLLASLAISKLKGLGDHVSSFSHKDITLTSQEQSIGIGHNFQLFSFDSIMTATDNFSVANKLGEGGFGPVYKGKLLEGEEIAVKRLSRRSLQGEKEFKNEIASIARLQHMNLVTLLGCCTQGEEKMLIYEFMPNKSLDFFIFGDETKRQLLNWKERFKIIAGIAQGLLYIHKYSRLKVIHRDLKASNILLDAEMNPKISDFGLARIFGHDEPEANTTKIAGTWGYMSPEYAMGGTFSMKSDVYSFGVLLLEISSGRKNTSFDDDDDHLLLVAYAWDLWAKGASIELVDPTLAAASFSCSDEDYCQNYYSFCRCVHVGLLCVQDCPFDRPSMLEVVSMLTSDPTCNIALPVPKQPFYSTRRRLVLNTETTAGGEECDHHNAINQHYSINGVTISSTLER